MFIQKKRSMLGVDVGSHAVKVVELTERGGGVALTGYGAGEISSQAAVSDVLSDILRHGGFQSRRAATALSGESVIVRFLNMVDVPDSKLKSAIQYEADRYIPFELDQAVTDCARLHEPVEEKGQMRALLVAAKKNLIEDRVSLLKRAGLDLEVVDVDPVAIGNAFELYGRASDDESVETKISALVDIGASKTVVVVVKNYEPRFTREIQLGGEQFTQAISKRLSVAVAEAEALKRDPGDRGTEVAEALSHPIDELASEIALSFDYYEDRQDGEPLEAVYLSGGGTRTACIAEALGRSFQRTTESWSPTEGLSIESDLIDQGNIGNSGGQLAVCVGLASRVVRENRR